MKHTKIVKDSRGLILIEVTLLTDRFYCLDQERKMNFRYDVTVWHTPPKKRTAYVNNSIATDEEILAAKMELHDLINPSKI